MNETGSFSADPEVVASELDGGAALLDLRSSQYYGLNAVGAFVWSELQAVRTIDSLADAVSKAFDVDVATCRPHIVKLLADFEAVGVIRRHV